jgi:dihydrodipicolinate synthase/N-acetylneuraminate lyase
MAKRIRFVKEQGASATLLGIPMWQPATLDMAVQHYADISAAFPDFGVMVYCNARAFRFPFGLDFWQGIAAKAPTVMAAKFSQSQIIKEAVEATKGRVNFCSGGQGAYRLAKVCPDNITTGWWLAAGLAPAKALMDAILSKDMQRADQIAADMEWAHEPQRAINSPEIFASFNIQFNRVFMEATGYCKPGPVRPPYIYETMPKEYYDGCWAAGERWAELEKKYAGMKAQAVGGGES